MSTKLPRGHTGLPPAATQMVIGVLLVVALIAFELFNYDTSRFALANLLGDIRFLGLGWATILAIAFCAIDFAGLMRFFMLGETGQMAKEVWYLMGAWLLGATMNALLTWWAVSLTLLSHELGNEVVGRELLLDWVPVFIAALVWLTRILFIGSFTVAGGYLFPALEKSTQSAAVLSTVPTQKPIREQPRHQAPRRAPMPQIRPVTDEVPLFLQEREATAVVSEDEGGHDPVPVGWQRSTPAPMYARLRR